MAKNSSESDGIRVLVCGSARFDDKKFVFGMLNGFANHFDISAVLSGPFTGADTFAKEWARERGVTYEPINIGESERMQRSFYDEMREIPELVIRNDPMFRKGYERIRDSGANAVLLIPNPEGKLGPTSACLKRMADILHIECIDGSAALSAVASRMTTAANQEFDTQQEALPAARSARVLG